MNSSGAVGVIVNVSLNTVMFSATDLPSVEVSDTCSWAEAKLIGWLNCTTIGVSTPISVAPLFGVMNTTLGGVTPNCQT